MQWEVVLKLFLAMVFGGLIGLERETGNRPAGFRTHTLVCMGSALVILTSEYMFQAYRDYTFIDPGRLGAQVISGIGFLGAGTILKDGSRVRGLTTAASLWVVACIGLAIGTGFYWGAITASIFSYITLVLLKWMEKHLLRDPRRVEIQLDIRNVPGQVAVITKMMAELRICIRDIKVAPGDDEWVQASFAMILPAGLQRKALETELSRLDGVTCIPEESD